MYILSNYQSQKLVKCCVIKFGFWHHWKRPHYSNII